MAGTANDARPAPETQLHSIMTTLGADMAVILSVTAAMDFEVVMATGSPPLPPVGARMAGGYQSLCGFVAQERGAVIFDNVGATARFRDSLMASEFGAISSLMVALRAGGSLIGVMGIHSRTPRFFTGAEARALDAVAHSFAGQLVDMADPEAREARIQHASHVSTGSASERSSSEDQLPQTAYPTRQSAGSPPAAQTR